MPMRDVHVPQVHTCRPEGDRPIGTIVRCDPGCGRYWWAATTDGCAPPSTMWAPVRWWHFGLWGRIRRWW